jgi:hypothetical protein
MRHRRGIADALSCSTTSASSQITIFTLGPKLVGGAPPPNTPRLAALAFLHPSAQATVAATVNVALSVVPFSAATNSYQRSPSQSLLSNQASRSGTIAGWGRSAPQHPPARCARVPLPVASSTSDDPTNNNGSQMSHSHSHFKIFRCSAKFLNPPMQNSKIYNS